MILEPLAKSKVFYEKYDRITSFHNSKFQELIVALSPEIMLYFSNSYAFIITLSISVVNAICWIKLHNAFSVKCHFIYFFLLFKYIIEQKANKYSFYIHYTKYNKHSLFKKYLRIDITLPILGTKEQHCCGILVLNLHAHVLIYITYNPPKKSTNNFSEKRDAPKKFFSNMAF